MFINLCVFSLVLLMDIYGNNQKTCVFFSNIYIYIYNLFNEMINIILAKMGLCWRRKQYSIKCTKKEIENYRNRVLTLGLLI